MLRLFEADDDASDATDEATETGIVIMTDRLLYMIC